jgi:putative spermidine/putrescine transport system permease protein
MVVKAYESGDAMNNLPSFSPTADVPSNAPEKGIIDRFGTFLYLRSNLILVLLLVLPLFWMLVFYILPLGSLLINSFYSLDEFSGRIKYEFGFASYAELLKQANLDIFIRTAGMAMAVTIACALLSFPLSYYMARYARGRTKSFLYLAVLLPLWSSYLIRVYAWKLILAKEGMISWAFELLGLSGLLEALLRLPIIGGPSLSFSYMGMFLVFVYVWIPYMILPIQAALERVPKGVIEASGDLGATPLQTFKNITLPLAFPGVVAGGIFTFSLTLGDFIVPAVLGNSQYFIGMAVLVFQGTAGNIPLAAAFTVVPAFIMIAYLMFARRTGAFEAL